LPLPDAAVDRILLVHALEMTHDDPALLREVWRVLAAGGRLLAVVPNRRGVWARMDTTPFGHGRPYSRSQITQLLRETWFTPTAWGEALYVPPIEQRWFLRSAVAWERTGATYRAVRRRAPRGSHQAGLSRHPGAPEKAGPEPRTRARAGARAIPRRGCPDQISGRDLD
jgi:SAM-dependent methyltransferase